MASTPKNGRVVKAKRAERSGREFIRNDAQAIEARMVAPCSCSSSAAAPADDDADVMDQAPTEAVVDDDSAQETGFEYVMRSTSIS